MEKIGKSNNKMQPVMLLAVCVSCFYSYEAASIGQRNHEDFLRMKDALYYKLNISVPDNSGHREESQTSVYPRDVMLAEKTIAVRKEQTHE